MKIGIMTINSAYNYGCVLQAWALQKYLENEGHQVSIINYRIPEIDNTYRLFREKQRFSIAPINNLYNCLRHVKFNLTQAPRIRKAAKFEHFINEVMNTTQVFSSFRELVEGKAGKDYDVLITGSDQVWNGTITKGLKPAYFLDFDHSGKRKISYAASIGKKELMNAEKEFFKNYLAEYESIAVRENSAAELLAPLVKKPVEVVLDPTLLLDREDFDTLKQSSKYQKPYIFVHVIGKDARLRRIVAILSEQTGLPIVQNRMKKQFPDELGRFSDAGPEEFIGLIEGAQLVITNSFHATVFAVIYEKNFITIPHKLNLDRLYNLLKMRSMENPLIASMEEMSGSVEELQPDYTAVKKKLKKRQQESREYLKRAVNGK